MNIKEYFDIELRSSLTCAFIGAIVGYLSFVISGGGLGIILMVVVLATTIIVLRKIWKIEKETKWWIGNGVIIYIFIWFAVWTIFYNLQMYSTFPPAL